MKLREHCRSIVEKEQAQARVQQEQQKLRQIEERKAREAALELKRQNEEREAALKAEQERLEAEKAKQEEAATDNLSENNESEKDEIETKPETTQIEENKTDIVGNISSDKELKNELEKSSNTNQISNATVIESQSTESIKQVANGQQINLPQTEAGTSNSVPKQKD